MNKLFPDAQKEGDLLILKQVAGGGSTSQKKKLNLIGFIKKDALRWKMRYCVLKKTELFIYKRIKQKVKLKTSINISNADLSEEFNKGNFCFSVYTVSICQIHILIIKRKNCIYQSRYFRKYGTMDERDESS